MNAVSRNNTSAHLYLTAMIMGGVRRDGVPDNRGNREPTSGPPLEMFLPNLKMGGYHILLKCINVLSSLNADRFAMDGQRSAKRFVRSWEKFSPALAQLFCLTLPCCCFTKSPHLLASFSTGRGPLG